MTPRPSAHPSAARTAPFHCVWCYRLIARTDPQWIATIEDLAAALFGWLPGADTKMTTKESLDG